MTRSISRDAAFALLSNRRRRQLLCLLARTGETHTLQAVAREIVERLGRVEPDGTTGEAYRSVYVSLYQNHAPQLAAEGIVDYDETDRTVRLADTRRTETLLRLVGIEPDRSRPVGRRASVVLVGATAGAALCGLLAFVDRIWLLPWAVLVTGLFAFQIGQCVGTTRIEPVDECGDLTATEDSPADVVDDGPHPGDR